MALTSKKQFFLLAIAYLVFVLGTKCMSPPVRHPEEVAGSIVLPAPMQAVLYFGDPYIAANVESFRVLATGGPANGVAQDYFDRLHQAVAILNPCHEDNYYIANSLMAWGGSADAAIAILQGATECRFWDEVPPFFLGFDLSFFKHEHRQARQMLEVAALRATDNRLPFQRMAILFEAEAYPDIKLAQRFLIGQRDQAQDPKLQELLNKRIGRLEGLIIMNDAQESYERRFGRPLDDPDMLVRSGVLKTFPDDPTGVGYVFEDGRFALREIKIRF